MARRARVLNRPSLDPRAGTQRFDGIALASAGAIAFSGKAIIVKLAYRYGVDAVTLIMYRMLFALPLFLAMSWWAGRDRPPLTGADRRLLTGLVNATGVPRIARPAQPNR